MVFVVLKCAKSSSCAKNHQKEMLSLCFKARRPFSMMKEPHPHHFQAQRRRERCCSCLQSPPSCHPKQKSDTTNTQTSKIRSVQHIQNSKFRFKSCEKRTQGSERCYAPRRRIEKNWVGCAFHRYHTTLRAFKI